MTNRSRRDFARLFALGGSAALFTGNAQAWTAAPQITGPAPASADENYWKQVRAGFVMPETLACVNAANLCPSPARVLDAYFDSTRSVDKDPSRVLDTTLQKSVAANIVRDQTSALHPMAGLIAGPAFDQPVHSAVHGDPWHENLLLGEDRLWLLDWEDLAVGDPVVDEAIVHMDAHGPDAGWPDTERHRVARRALFLDAVIDVAADWVEATDPVVRATKERSWRAGLEAYRAAYP